MRIAVTGAGGAIGGHMIRRLLDDGHEVRAFDVKPIDEWWQLHGDATNFRVDVSEVAGARTACLDAQWVFNYACVMGGIPFIETHMVDCALSVLITANMLKAAAEAGVERFFQSSSACVYRTDLQMAPDVAPLSERDAWPALPERGYGLEKLYGEELCRFFYEESGLQTRVGRFHNIYGTHCSWNDGKEKAPAALCRKVAECVVEGFTDLRVYGDGKQTRSFCYVDDCVEGSLRLMASDYAAPVNIGSAELVTVDELLDVIEFVAGAKFERTYDRSAPQGVRGRCSDNTLVRSVLNWEPAISLREGIERLYPWVHAKVVEQWRS